MPRTYSLAILHTVSSGTLIHLHTSLPYIPNQVSSRAMNSLPWERYHLYWINREKLFLDEGEDKAFLFRFIEMRGYREGYEGSCYWISFHARRPYAKKEGPFSGLS